MKRFHFKLEKLLKIRAHREREWELKLAEITGICLRIEGRILDLLSKKREAFSERSPGGRKDVSYLFVNELYLERIDVTVKSLRKELKDKERLREEVRKQFIEASREKRILEKLKERRKALDYNRQKEEEIKEIDDSNISNFSAAE